MRHKIESLFAILMLLSVISAFTPVVRAQEPGIDPWADPDYTGEEQIDRKKGQLKAKSSPALPEQIQLVNRRMTGLMEVLQSEVVAYTSAWAMRMAQLLAGLILLFSFLRVWRENSGKGQNLYWWFARLGICLGLLGSSPYQINELAGIGKEIAEGGPTRNSAIFRFYDRNQANFSESYAMIAQNTFKVRVPEQEELFAVKPVNSTETFMGVLFDQESTVRDLNNKLQNSTFSLPTLYAWLGACRGILEGGELWLMILAGVLLMVSKLFAPIAVALAIDQKLANRISYPFLWGIIVLTLIWPTVSYFIRGLAYMFGNVAMALGDSAPVYVWNEATMQAFRNVGSQPLYTVLFACFTMTVTALCLWLSPVIAYQISTGRIYEGVSNAASTFAGAVVGTAVEMYSSVSAAKLNQEAAQVQADAGFESASKIAGGDRNAADLSAAGAWELGGSQVEGNRFSQLAQARAQAMEKKSNINADRDFNKNANNEQSAHNKRVMGAAAIEKNLENFISGQQAVETLKYGAIDKAFGNSGGWISSRGLSTSTNSTPVPAPGGSVPAPGGPAPAPGGGKSGGGFLSLDPGLLLTQIGNVVGFYGQSHAVADATKQRQSNTQGYYHGINAGTPNSASSSDFGEFGEKMKGLHTGGVIASQDTLTQNMNNLYDNRANAQVNAAQAYANQVEGGINRSADIQLKGLDRNAELQMLGNKERYDAHIGAAEINRGAAIEASRLHAMESVVRSVGSKIARDIEGGMTLRY
jgi:hypothetical protein